ncbi:MAG: hypothetical protein GY953_26525 [bacterium]|nr:hypothetical protein [bacterium]
MAALQIGCLGGRPEPVEIALNEEICSHCRMAVSQRQFAGEVVTPSGRVDYFDDIGCLAAWLRQQQPATGAGVFVVDYENGEWLEAAAAQFVRSEAVSTPMGSGLTAFATSERAAAAAEKFPGRVLDWQGALREVAQ